MTDTRTITCAQQFTPIPLSPASRVTLALAIVFSGIWCVMGILLAMMVLADREFAEQYFQDMDWMDTVAGTAQYIGFWVAYAVARWCDTRGSHLLVKSPLTVGISA